MRAPFVPLPRERTFFLLSILRNSIPPTDPADQVARNREIYEQVRDAGGKRYAIGSVPFDTADWREHFGPIWPRFRTAKARFDPDNELTPGQGIFSS